MSNTQEIKAKLACDKGAGRGTGKQMDPMKESLEAPGLPRTQFQRHSFNLL